MKINFLKNIQKSIFVKLILVLLLTGILVNLLVSSFFRIIFSEPPRIAFQKNITNYINYVIKDIGVPPDTLRARQIAQELGLQIRYESPTFNWTTSEKLPSIKKLKLKRFFEHHNIQPDKDRTINVKTARHKGKFIVAVNKGESWFIFVSHFRQYVDIREEFVIILVLLLTLILVGAYFSIKRILEPIKLLTKGVDEISKGNLKHQISVTKKDELGELANSFNSMTKIINEMIRSKEQLLLDVSHELRSPLTRIKVAMEFLPDGKAKESISEDISEMEKMITEILETERLNSNYGKLNLEIYNISEIIKEVSEDFKDRQPGIKLIDIPKQVLLNIDVNRIKTVFNNILGNSLKYSKNQNQPIEISLSEQEKEIKIQIRDYGVGIPEKDLPFIFEPFYRVDRSRSKDTGGYGLGMSLCKKIMDAHGGKIEIKSSVNKGTTVELTFKK